MRIIYYLLIGVLVTSIFVFCLTQITIKNNNLDFSFKGFAVDSQGQVYIGRTMKIEIYRDGTYVRSLPSTTNRAYGFTIEDDQIKMSNSTSIRTMDFSGNIVSEVEDNRSQFYLEHEGDKVFYSDNGDKYTYFGGLTRPRIQHDHEVVYQMPLSDYRTMLANFLSQGFMFLSLTGVCFFSLVLPRIQKNH